MKIVRSALRDQLELAAAALARAGELAAYDTAELLDGVDRGIADDGAEAARLIVIDVEAVQRDIYRLVEDEAQRLR